MSRAGQEAALAAVEQHFASHAPTREWMDLPIGKRQVIVVKGDRLAVHPKSYVSRYRKTNTLEHGLRTGLLHFYAENGIFLVVYEEDTGTILVASAASCLARAGRRTMDGMFGGMAEETAFIPRSVFHFVNRPHDFPPADVR